MNFLGGAVGDGSLGEVALAVVFLGKVLVKDTPSGHPNEQWCDYGC